MLERIYTFEVVVTGDNTKKHEPDTVRLMLHFGLEYGCFVETHFFSKIYKCLSETQSSALS